MNRDTLILGLNPTWQRLFILEKLHLGSVNRLPPADEYASGKGINCARVLKSLGNDPLLVHFLGTGHGKQIFDEVATAGVKQVSVWIREATRISTTIIQGGETTELIEPSPVLSSEENEDFIQSLKDSWKNAGRVVLCGSFPAKFQAEKMFELDTAGKRLFIDAVSVDSWLEREVELLKVNMDEYRTLLQRYNIPQVTSSPQFWKMTATALLERLHIRTLIVTDRAAPVRAFRVLEGKLQTFQLSPPPVSLVNDIGAGDAFMAGWLYGDSLGLSLEDCLVKATAVAAARCEAELPWELKMKSVELFEQELAGAIAKAGD
ncbi:MAG: PfkB family carbohydrate kinase [Fibrobacter sp.]|nr:PfkB family carbohydrate kinase [Fibrobacter sp.]